MNWTNVTPTKPGMYWVQYRNDQHTTWYNLSVWVCFIEPAHPPYSHKPVTCLIDLYDDSETIDVDDFGDNRVFRFSGPIPHPNLDG